MTPNRPTRIAAAGGPHSCNGCGSVWTGTRAAHASCCHKTFANASLFDKHRTGTGEHGTCRHPATITTTTGDRIMFLRDGIWRSPEMTDEQKTLAFGNRS